MQQEMQNSIYAGQYCIKNESVHPIYDCQLILVNNYLIKTEKEVRNAQFYFCPCCIPLKELSTCCRYSF